MAKQFTFSFLTQPSFRPEDFLVSDCNRKAWMWMQPSQHWAQPVFVLRGPKASGKSHLAALWAARCNAPIIDASTIEHKKPPAEYFAGGTVLVVENIEEIEHESALFHLYNYAMQQENSLLLTMDSAYDWEHFMLPDLRSRLQAAPQAQISEPDDMLLAALLIKHLTDRQLGWNDALIAYLLPRLERSFVATRQVVEKLDALALQQKQPLGVSLARQVLNGL